MEHFSINKIPEYTKNMILTFINNLDDLSRLEMFVSTERAKTIFKERNCQKNQKFGSFEDLPIIDEDFKFLSSITVSKPQKTPKEIVEFISKIASDNHKNSKTIFISFNKL